VEQPVGQVDGDLATTAVTQGGKPVRLLAESPRKLVFESPLSVTGGHGQKLQDMCGVLKDLERIAAGGGPR
jgi:hypothetical protein